MNHEIDTADQRMLTSNKRNKNKPKDNNVRAEILQKPSG